MRHSGARQVLPNQDHGTEGERGRSCAVESDSISPGPNDDSTGHSTGQQPCLQKPTMVRGPVGSW